MKSRINAKQIEKCLIQPFREFIAGALVERLLVDCLSVVAILLIPYVVHYYALLWCLFMWYKNSFEVYDLTVGVCMLTGGA